MPVLKYWDAATSSWKVASGSQGPQGPPGPTQVSSDTGNSATIGSDGKIFVPTPTGGTGGGPTGDAGGDLSGPFDNLQIVNGAISDADISNTANIAQAKISGLTTSLAGKYPTTGGTITGGVAVSPTAGSASLSVTSADSNTRIIIRSPAGAQGGLEWYTDSTQRWAFIKDTTAESGTPANTGANLGVYAFDDAGVLIPGINPVLYIVRSTGEVRTFVDPTTPTGVANKRYVDSGGQQTLNAQTGTTYTLVVGDLGKLVTLSNASAITVTVPSALGLLVGQRIDFVQLGTGQVTFVGSGVTINSASGLKLRTQYATASLIYMASATYLLTGDLSA